MSCLDYLRDPITVERPHLGQLQAGSAGISCSRCRPAGLSCLSPACDQLEMHGIDTPETKHEGPAMTANAQETGYYFSVHPPVKPSFKKHFLQFEVNKNLTLTSCQHANVHKQMLKAVEWYHIFEW